MHKDMTYDEYRHEVKEGILTEAGNCPVTPLLLMLQGKWKFQILYELFIQDPIRFGELKKNGIIPFNLVTPLLLRRSKNEKSSFQRRSFLLDVQKIGIYILKFELNFVPVPWS